MNSKQYANDLIAKSCEFAVVYDESTLNDFFIEEVDASSRQSFATTGRPILKSS